MRQGTSVSAARILVVEDEASIADVVARYLRRDGHEVETIGDGAKAMMYVRLESKPVDNGEAAGILRYARTVEYEWQTPNAENANFMAQHLPHIWIDWPQRPSEEGHRYYFVGRITGGYPAIDKELALGFHESGGMFRVQTEEDGRFIFPLPEFEAREHGGTYKITGRVLAISSEELRKHGRRE